MKITSKLMIIVLSLSFLLSGCGGNTSEEAKKEITSYQVYLDVEFEGNLLFDKYDVDVCFDEQKLDTIAHGSYYTKLLSSIEEGEHELLFYKHGDESIKGEYQLKVNSDTTFKCKIHAKGSEIKIDEVQTMDSIEGNSIQMIDTKGMNLQEAMYKLADLGFVTITSEAEDDVIFVESNWIVISQNVEAGKEYDKNTEIILNCKHIEDEQPTSEDSQDADTANATNPATTETENNRAEDVSDSITKEPSNQPEETQKASIYDLAYKVSNTEYAVYYLIDQDGHTVCNFSTGDTSVLKASYTGELDEGIDVSYSEEDHEYLKYKREGDDTIILVTNANDPDYEYAAEFTKTTVEEAEENLQRLIGQDGKTEMAEISSQNEPMIDSSGDSSKVSEEELSVTAEDLDIRYQTDYGHVSDTICLGNDEGVTITVKVTDKSLSEDNLFLVYDESVIAVDQSKKAGTNGYDYMEYYVTGKTAGSVEIYFVVTEEYEKLGDNASVRVIPVRILDSSDGRVVYYTPTGEKYHLSAECAGPNASKTTLHDVAALEMEPCGKCAQ